MDKHSMDRDNLVALIEDHIPIYKLRAESEQTSDITKNLIKTPILDKAYNLDLSPEFIFETLKYFVDCGERLTQMTKTYDDIDAVTKLLEEKEHDLELAARIGNSLLEQNNTLKSRIDQLESDYSIANETIDKLNYELLTANELIIQLKHDLSNKNGLIQMYNDFENEELVNESSTKDNNDNTSLLVSWQSLHDKVLRLEDDNQRLRREATVTNKEIDFEEKKEITLIRDVAKQLNESNLKLINLQDELTKRTEDSIGQQEEITTLISQQVEMQRRCRDLYSEKEGLESALQLSKECQYELSTQLIELKDKYDLLVRAFDELKDELNRNKHSSLGYLGYETEDSLAPLHFIPIGESLQTEIESTLESEGYGSEFSSLNTVNFLNDKQHLHINQNNLDSSSNKSTSPDNLIDKSCESLNDRQRTSSRCSNDNSSISTNTIKSFSMPNKLKIVKPLEGSETLGRWKQLATPHLGVILESQTGVQNRVLKGVDKDLIEYALKKESPNDNELTDENVKKDDNELEKKSPNKLSLDGNHFGVTASIYTFTTTSLSQNTEITSVTPSLSNLQLATGHQLPITSISSSPTIFSKTFVSHKDNVNLPATPVSTPTIEEQASSLNLSNMISHFIRNTGSYFMSKSNSSDKISKEANKMKTSSSLTDFNALVDMAKNNLNQTTIVSKANDSANVSAGLAALSRQELNSKGILMKGNLITRSQLNKEVVDSLIKSRKATKLEGFNALLLDVTNKIEECHSKNIYIGKVSSIKILRKGGYF